MIKLRTECSHGAWRFQAGRSVRSTGAANSTGETNAANAANPVHATIAKDATRATIAATAAIAAHAMHRRRHAASRGLYVPHTGQPAAARHGETCDRTPRRRGTGYHMARPPGALPGRDPLPFHPQHAATPP
ncbi:hypothetical protein LFL97_29940 [Burkholderia sp. JSH-S8]|nr:hypothetical protein LFL97_29940 [Burkholderia sp. JSH-S8]